MYEKYIPVAALRPHPAAACSLRFRRADRKLKNEHGGIKMTPESVMTIGQQALELTLMVSAPMLLTALIIGLIVSIFQAATQINEMTLSFIPKLVGMFVVLIISGPWMIGIMLDYMTRLYSSIPYLAG
jgi:flagellar biosynthetic protein FliQ